MLILASASPRRAQLLTAAGVRFEVDVADIDESVVAGETADAYVQRLAGAKAGVVAARHPGRRVLGADTSVVVDGAIFGKAADADQARAMLARLAGRAHLVLTGVALLGDVGPVVALASTTVTVAPMTPAALDDYVASGEWCDKAGAYAIQGRMSQYVTKLQGSYTNVVGLPVSLVCALLMRYPDGQGAARSTP